MALVRNILHPDEVYEVYGARESSYEYSDYEGDWTETHTEILIHCGSWSWQKVDKYEPVKS
jgi:hypothetical protein